MTLEANIARSCNPRSLTRGRAIASSDRNILTKQVRYDADETIVSAFVASSSGWDDRYRTSVILDEEMGDVVDYSCTCPAFREYMGMCKHCIALALNFNERPEQYMGWQPRRQAASSACISELMRRAERLEDDDTPRGSITLLPELCCAYDSWSVTFRIVGGEGTPYVLKSIGEFVERMYAGQHHAYGKKLAFTHVRSALDGRSREIERFLERACETRCASEFSSPWYSRQSVTLGRTLSLTEAEAVELFEILDGATFPVKGGDYATPSIDRVHIEHADAPVSVRLVKTDRGGWAIERGDRVRLVEHADQVFAWLGGDVIYRCSKEFSRCADFLRNVYESQDRMLFISDEDMPLFCAAVLPVIEAGLSVEAPEEIDAYRRVPCAPRFYFDKDAKRVMGAAEAVYGNRVFRLRGRAGASAGDDSGDAGLSVPAGAGAGRERGDVAGGPGAGTGGGSGADGGGAGGPLRDARTEGKACTLFDRFFTDPAGTLPMKEEDTVARLVFTGLSEFRSLGEVFTTPAFDKLIRDGKPRLTMGVSLAGNLINLTVQADDLPADDLAAMLSSYRRKKRYHRLRDGAFVDLEDFDMAQLDRLASDLGFSAKDLAAGSVELPSYRAFYLDEEENIDRDRSFDDYIDHFRAVNEADYEVPASLRDVLRPYQAEGFRWLSARCDAGFGGVLADEMGLGKSVQLISLLLARRDEGRQVGPSIIVCPSSLVYNWTAELERFAPELNVLAVAGAAAERKVARGKVFSDWEAALSVKTGNQPDESSLVDVIITSYDLARIDSAGYAGRRFFICALDEAQYIKNPATLTTRAVKRLEASHRFALTGTPMENRLSELWSIFDFLMPGLLGPYARFRERFELPIVGGEEDVAARLQALVGPFMLRRCKADVLTDLPDKLESVVYAPLEGQQRKLYAACEQQLREQLTRQRAERKQRQAKRAQGEEVSTVEVLAELTKLRQLCCDPRLVYENYRGHGAKLDAIAEIIASAMDAGEKTLVFSQFTSFLDLIAQQLRTAGTRFYTITGSTPKKQRVELVDAFNGDDVPVFLVSLKAGGTGLNLTGASVVIHADPWWNAAAQQQATDRAHRIGQKRVVSVQKVIAKGTIEERILRLQEEKSKLADQVIGASGISLASLSADDLIELLAG